MKQIKFFFRQLNSQLFWPTIFLALCLNPLADAASVLYGPGVNAIASGAPVPGNPLIVWASIPHCILSGDVNNSPGDNNQPVQIIRGSREGVLQRTLLSINPNRAWNVCNPYKLLSNLVTDGSDIFFVDNQGPRGSGALWKRSVNSNPADASTLIAYMGAVTSVELHLPTAYNTVIMLILHSSGLDTMQEYTKSGAYLGTVETGQNGALHDMQSDARFLYWRNQSNLRRDDMTNGQQATLLTNLNVSDSYYAGNKLVSLSLDDFTHSLANKLYTSWTTSTTISSDYAFYTSSTANANIASLFLDYYSRTYFIETRPLPCPGGCGPLGSSNTQQVLNRLVYNNSVIPTVNTIDLINMTSTNFGSSSWRGLTGDDSFLFYWDVQNLYRLPMDAAAIPVFKIAAKGLEVTQGIQSSANDVRLIENKRTFVRFYVKSNDTNTVYVPAKLTVANSAGNFIGELDPINNVGKSIHVVPDPNRAALNDSFLFEIPLAWTKSGPLKLTATVNPYAGTILEDTYADNSATATVSFSPSPILDLQFVDFAYIYTDASNNSQLRFVNPTDDWDSENWIQQVYPLGLATSSLFSTPGLHVEHHNVVDLDLASRVDHSNADCKGFIKKNPDGSNNYDDQNLCAATYVNNKIADMLKSGELSQMQAYGSIPQPPIPAGSIYSALFTRGFTPAKYGLALAYSSGPSASKDLSVEYMNYAAHEVGHQLGRNHPDLHPNTVNDSCNGQTYDDPNYPYSYGRISDNYPVQHNDTSIDWSIYAGLDTGRLYGDNNAKDFAYLSASTTYDIMTYCGTYWISPYTYENIYQALPLTRPAPAVAKPLITKAAASVQAAVAGDWLTVNGMLNTSTLSGQFGQLRHRDSVVDTSLPVAGAYTFQFIDANGNLLTSYAFSADPISDAGANLLHFDFVLPFASGARSLQVVDNTSGAVWIKKAVSPAPPTISNIQLATTGSPLVGTVNLSWTAADQDGNPLSFDLYQSTDGGVSFRPIAMAIPTNSYNLDTGALAGGTSIFRIKATDGIHTAYADSASYPVAGKAPQLRIMSPLNNGRFQWNQLVSFQTAIHDLQDGDIPDANIVWSNQYGVLGSGHILQTTSLPVGLNNVVLTATNSLGLQTTASMQITVGDSLLPPPPSLQTTPSAVSWQLSATESVLQTSQINVSNAGTGTLVFSASSDSAWLTVNTTATQTGLTAPASLQISADPTQLAGGHSYTGNITLQNASNPADKIVIPVSVSKGFGVTGPSSPDSDGDGVFDYADNCVKISNLSQLDTDQDGFGNLCDADLNNDCKTNSLDLGLFKQVYGSAASNSALANNADLNGDGKVNSLDLGTFKLLYAQKPGPSGLASCN